MLQKTLQVGVGLTCETKSRQVLCEGILGVRMNEALFIAHLPHLSPTACLHFYLSLSNSTRPPSPAISSHTGFSYSLTSIILRRNLLIHFRPSYLTLSAHQPLGTPWNIARPPQSYSGESSTLVQVANVFGLKIAFRPGLLAHFHSPARFSSCTGCFSLWFDFNPPSQLSPPITHSFVHRRSSTTSVRN